MATKCPHGTSGGARYCALCRAAVLAAGGRLPFDVASNYGPGRPMPAWFRAAVERAAREAAPPVQHELDLQEETA